jgi:hypothetical protein
MKIFNLASVAFAISLLAGAASALTTSISTTLPGTAVANLAPTSTGSTGVVNPNGTLAYYDNVVGNQFVGGTMVARSPWEGTGLFGTGMFSSVSQNSFATFSFGIAQTGFSLVWGSPDNYNNLDIVLSGGGAPQTINGSALVPPGTLGAAAVLLTVSDVTFDTLTFRSTQNAFEFANLTTTPVPLPAAAWMLIASVGGLFAVAGRRKAA